MYIDWLTVWIKNIQDSLKGSIHFEFHNYQKIVLFPTSVCTIINMNIMKFIFFYSYSDRCFEMMMMRIYLWKMSKCFLCSIFYEFFFFSSPPFITNQSPFYTHTHVQLYSRTLFSVCCVESFLRERERKREVSLLFSSIIIHISIIAFISIYIIYWDSLIGHPPITYTHTNVTWEKFS